MFSGAEMIDDGSSTWQMG